MKDSEFRFGLLIGRYLDLGIRTMIVVQIVKMSRILN
jgi:hypothetical protein